MYAQDYDEIYPVNTWQASGSVPTPQSFTVFNRILPYVKNQGVFICPSAPSPNHIGNGINSLPTNTYGVNSFVGGQSMANTNIDQPADIIAAGDGISIWWDTCQNAWRMSARHLDMINLAFLDGHVKVRRVRTVKPSEFWKSHTGFYGTPSGCGGYPVQWDALPGPPTRPDLP